MAENGNVTNEILTALATASDDRKTAALRALRGEQDPAQRPMTGPLVLGMGAAAKYLGVSRPTLWRMIQAGRLEKVQLFPGSHRIRRADLERICDRPKRDARFEQLKALADEGDENAAADLFKEYNFVHNNPGRDRA